MAISSDDPLAVICITGVVHGVVGVVSSHPLDTIKTRLQTGHTAGLSRHLFKGVLFPAIAVGPNFLANYLMMVWGLHIFGKESYFWAGAFGGIAYAQFAIPADRVKIIAQDMRISSMDACRYILKQNGVRSLFKGYSVGVLKHVTFDAVWLWSYHFLQRTIPGYNHCFYGMGMGVIAWQANLPIDVVKTLVQRDICDTAREATKKIYKEHGIKGFWRGYFPCIIRAMVFDGCGVLCAERVRKYLYRYEKKYF